MQRLTGVRRKLARCYQTMEQISHLETTWYVVLTKKLRRHCDEKLSRDCESHEVFSTNLIAAIDFTASLGTGILFGITTTDKLNSWRCSWQRPP